MPAGAERCASKAACVPSRVQGTTKGWLASLRTHHTLQTGRITCPGHAACSVASRCMAPPQAASCDAVPQCSSRYGRDTRHGMAAAQRTPGHLNARRSMFSLDVVAVTRHGSQAVVAGFWAGGSDVDGRLGAEQLSLKPLGGNLVVSGSRYRAAPLGLPTRATVSATPCGDRGVATCLSHRRSCSSGASDRIAIKAEPWNCYSTAAQAAMPANFCRS